MDRFDQTSEPSVRPRILLKTEQINNQQQEKPTKTIPLCILTCLLAVCANGATLTITPGPLALQDSLSNVGPGKSRQFVGSYITEASEFISVQRTEFILFGKSIPEGALTSVEIYREGGGLIAGPFDSRRLQNGLETITVTDLILYFGRQTNIIRATVSRAFTNDARFSLATAPRRDWHDAKAVSTSEAVIPTSEWYSVELGWNRVMYPALTVSTSPGTQFRAAIAGSRQTTGLTVSLSTLTSSEGVFIPSLPVMLRLSDGAQATDITNIGWYSGTNRLSTGVNTVNPLAAGLQRIVFDGTGLVTPVAKESILTLKFDIRSGAVGDFEWSLPDDPSEIKSTGLASAIAFVPTFGPRAPTVIRAVPYGVLQVNTDTAPRRTLVPFERNISLGKLVLWSQIEQMEARTLTFQLTTTNVTILEAMLLVGTNAIGPVPVFRTGDGVGTVTFSSPHSSAAKIRTFTTVELIAPEVHSLTGGRGSVTMTLTSIEATGVDSGFNLKHIPSQGSLEPATTYLDRTRIEHIRTEMWPEGVRAVFFHFVIPQDGKKYVLEESTDAVSWLPKKESLVFEGPDDGARDGGAYGNYAPLPHAFYRLRELTGPLPVCPVGSYLIIDKSGNLTCR